MAKYQINVEIPDGKYCSDCNIFCSYIGDAHYGAGCCSLILEGDVIIHWEDENKPIEERKYKHILKHPTCPSLHTKEVGKE